MNHDFPFSDTIAGYVTVLDSNRNSFGLKTSDDRHFEVHLTETTYAELVRNLCEAYIDATGTMREMLTPGRYLYAYGVYYPQSDGNCQFEAKHLVFLGRTSSDYFFEKSDWWVQQIRSLADFYMQAQFGDGEIDFRQYRTNISLYGNLQGECRQETDTISRLVYGFATAYMLTGEDRYLQAAEKGTEYLREHMRYLDQDEQICYWYHAIELSGTHEKKIFASEFGDDYEAIPAYEQIYALAGPTQTYRITGDPRILSDIEMTLNLFDRYFLDRSEHGGYFSHISPVTLDPHSPQLGRNQARKNWNSVGDHAPAYLINLFLATGAQRYADMLTYTADTIERRFPDLANSPLVQERFYADWSPDTSWGWQQNRAVVGHNLKIAWNLMRIHHQQPSEKYVALARRIAELMPEVGSDQQRGGWYDVIERLREPDQKFHRFVWHDRKAWWQQEQAILAYMILGGSLQDPEYVRLARESAAFYNAWFLDHDSGGIYFNVLANGLPYLLGTERSKGSHSMSGYHSFELAYLATVYTNLLVTRQPMTLYFKPQPGAFPDGKLRVQPDLLPPDSIRLAEVWINDQPYSHFDAEALVIDLPPSDQPLNIKVRIVPTQVPFDVTLLDVTDGIARLYLGGALHPTALPLLDQELDKVLAHKARQLVLLMQNVDCISGTVMRALIFIQQKLPIDVEIYVIGAREPILEMLKATEFHQRITVLDEEPAFVV
jgi:mannose/cellobiose epimerase-like protein (N-acyl-D-glucosamine 2-epimerase family)/anti-anti-sigma regulatory factor